VLLLPGETDVNPGAADTSSRSEAGMVTHPVTTTPDATIGEVDAICAVDGGGVEAEVVARVEQIKADIERTDSDWDREKLQERLAKLAGGRLRG
jgi:hypothetical protein